MSIKKLITKGIMLVSVLFVFNTSFAGWELLQNSPTTNDLHSVFFINDNTGWIAGYNNTIHKTTNSGESWVQQTSPIASNFECITFIDANTGWACGSGGTVIKTTNGGASWFSQTFTAVKFNSLYFINANTGYICGDNGIIWKTINGGSNWVNQPSGITQNLHQIKFMNSTTGFAVGDYAYILKTSTGGNSWDIKSGPELLSRIFYTVDFHNDTVISTGTLTKYSTNSGVSWSLGDFPSEPIYSIITSLGNLGVGGNGYIAHYDSTWIIEQSPTNQNLYSVHYQDSSSVIWVVGANGTILRKMSIWIKQTVGTANSLYSVCFINANKGFIVGTMGTILKTTNSGTNWDILSSGTQNTLWSVYFTDANTGYTVGSNGTILSTTNSGINWEPQNSGTQKDLIAVYFTDVNNGFAVGWHGLIIRTTNRGTNWDTLSSGTTSVFHSVFFTDANTGYVVGFPTIILKTTNSGYNWVQQTSPEINNYQCITFVDANTGWVCGSSGIIKTTNSGTNWISQTSPSTNTLFSVCFIDANLGYLCSWNSIYKTIDGGINWYEDELPPISVNGMQEIKFVVENGTAVGFAVGDLILRTSFEYFGGEPIGNNGNYPGWVGLTSGTNQSIGGVDYINPFIAFAVGMRDPPGTGTGTILRTINGGQTWTSQQSNVNAEFGSVSFADVNNGIAVGYPAFIVRTTNSGANWVQQTSPTGHTLIDVDMLDASHAFICGDDAILYTSNGGNNWIMQTSGIFGAVLVDIEFINQTTATTVGSSGIILRTTNAGANWFTQNSGVLDQIRSIDFINVNTGIAITQFGPTLRTTNGGANWLHSDTLGYTQGVCYIDSVNAFATGYEGLIYRTTNGGINWTLQNANTTENFQSVNFADVNNGIIVGQNGTIIRTSNAGVISGTNTAYKKNNLNLPINDFQNTTDSININITDHSNVYAVTRVYLKVDTVLHTNDNDLEFYLEHNGITDTIIYRNGGNGDNFLGTFLNDATNFPLVSGTPPFKGSFKPYKPLSKFNGQNPNGAWKLRIYDRASGNTGILEAWSLTLTYQIVSGITGNTEIPAKYQLSQNYPNPFNPVTKIKFSIPGGAGRDLSVKLRIYDILGRQIATLINQQMRPGNYIVEWNAGNFSSGVYFYRLETDNFIQTKKMVLVK